ncbi:MAG: PEP-CTERM sorting domain-containing protein [Lysobacteraceae bacterium]|uniref:FxDxF family PEP-CTERM protein n=1 Tax=Sphingomonas phyllosphaerae TaxID=257003 RepID=UPI000423AE28|nr:FxDxF family PEP-CTERM protein [Sphingomonas phyllosphaerae]RYD25932.1 MAG: PEP-CTERM sorting domain-containing protein [Xanthomonadaceae bacterium]
MKKFFAAAVVAASFAAATPAMAVNYVVPLNETSPGFFTGDTIVSVSTNGAFSDTFSFMTPVDFGNIGASAITLTLTGALTFQSVILNGTPLNLTVNQGQYTAATPIGGFPAGANPQKLIVNGSFAKSDAQPSGRYSALVEFRATPAVPEPGTWALMILGFGVVGYAMRRRPSVRFAQAI